MGLFAVPIIALRNEKGSYNIHTNESLQSLIIALRNEKGSYNFLIIFKREKEIIALRNEKGSYNLKTFTQVSTDDYSTAK